MKGDEKKFSIIENKNKYYYYKRRNEKNEWKE